MKNALDFFGTKDLFNFGEMPIFKSLFGDFVPSNFTNSPKVNVKETDKAYEIEIANPGFSKDETKIKVENDTLTVSMTCEEKKETDEKYHCKQWSKSSYNESWYLPENVIVSEITAKNNDGVLTITLPKKEVSEKKDDSWEIEIQ